MIDLGVSFSPSDSAVKQILVTLDEKPGQSFIIEDLDEFHVLVRADEEQRVRRELEAQVCPPFLSYTQPILRSFPDGDARSWRRIRIAWKLRCHWDLGPAKMSSLTLDSECTGPTGTRSIRPNRKSDLFVSARF